MGKNVKIFGTAGQAGYSLTNLMVTLCIFTITACIAVPTFIFLIPDAQRRGAARDLYATFRLAQLTAIRSGVHCTVTLNQTVDGVVYSFVAFEDRDNDMEYDPGSDKVIKKVLWGTDQNYEHISLQGYELSSNDDGLPHIGFRSNGFPTENGGFDLSNGPERTVTLQDTQNKEMTVVITQAGHVRIL